MFKSLFSMLGLQKRERRSLSLAEAKLDDSLDIVRLIRMGRSFRTLLRLLLPKNERRLIRFQKREAVVGDHASGMSSADELSDSQLLQVFRRHRDINHVQSNFMAPAHELSFIDKLRRGVLYHDWNQDEI